MARALVLVLALLACAARAPAQDFEAVFGRRYTAAVDYARSRAAAWRAQCRQLGADEATLIPVVFPELLRYSFLRSEAESLGLAALYVARGTKAADYSVGRFQMKPSFVEALEGSLARLPSVPDGFARMLAWNGARSERDRRSMRLDRMRSEDWQMLYLACFQRIVENRFPLDALPIDERIRFLSSAYNGGFQRSRDDIVAGELLRMYPDGHRGGRPAPYRYVDVAVDFYHRCWQALSAGG